MVAAQQAKPPIFGHEPLTVLPVVDEIEGVTDRYYVLGNHEWWYEATLDRESRQVTCECKAGQYRGYCCHAEAVKEYLRRELTCPACGDFMLSYLEFVEGKGYVVRARCSKKCGWVKVL